MRRIKYLKKVLFGGDKFMPKLHLRQPESSGNAADHLQKNRESIQKFKETRDLRCIYQNEEDKTFSAWQGI